MDPGGPDHPSRDDLRYQLLRYAEDLNVLLEQREALEQAHSELADTYRVMRQSQNTLERLINTSHDIHIATDLDGTILQSNTAARNLFLTGDLLGSNLYELLPESASAIDEASAAAIKPGNTGSVSTELILRRTDAGLVKLQTQVAMVQHAQDDTQLHWLMRDTLVDINSGFETNLSSMAFLNTAEAIMVTNPEGVIVSVNPAFTQITGYAIDEVIGQTPRVLKSGIQDATFYEKLWAALKAKGAWQGKIMNRRKSGEIYAQWLNVTASRHGDGSIASYICAFTDMTPLSETDKCQAFLSHHDTLTGLPHRELFLDRLGRTLSHSRRSGNPFTLMLVELDQLGEVNDQHGPHVADQVLQQAASRLNATVRDSDTVARFDDNLFAILLPNLCTKANISTVTHKLKNALSAPMLIEGESIFISCSIGCVEFPKDGQEEALLMQFAETALHNAKQAGGNTHAFHQVDEIESIRLEMALGGESSADTSEAQYELFYQPQYDISVRPPRLIGVESLLRWQRGEGEDQQTPAEFMPGVERRGALHILDKWALRAACAQVRSWQEKGLPDLVLAVNASSDLIRTPDFVDELKRILDDTGLGVGSLELEIDARDAFSDLEGDQSRLWLLWSMGIRLAIDGIGDVVRKQHGNLLNLKSPPLSRLKIHPSIVTNLREGHDSLAVCRSVLCIGKAFGLEVTAVGVESAQILELLKKYQCKHAQGYYLGEPMPAEEFAAWAQIV